MSKKYTKGPRKSKTMPVIWAVVAVVFAIGGIILVAATSKPSIKYSPTVNATEDNTKIQEMYDFLKALGFSHLCAEWNGEMQTIEGSAGAALVVSTEKKSGCQNFVRFSILVPLGMSFEEALDIAEKELAATYSFGYFSLKPFPSDVPRSEMLILIDGMAVFAARPETQMRLVGTSDLAWNGNSEPTCPQVKKIDELSKAGHILNKNGSGIPSILKKYCG